jgi:hypothetical protein
MTWMPRENMVCSVWRRPAANQRIGDFPNVRKDGGILHISPDGQKIIAEALVAPDVWLLENFEPKQQAAK